MADTKASQTASPAPIALKDLIQSFAATVVTTSQHLDQATVDLRNLYINSGNLGLAAMIPPRYVMDEVTVDLSFIVVEAKPDVPDNTDLPDEDKKASKTVLQVNNPASSDLVHSKLSDVAKANALADAKAKSAQIDAIIKDLQKRLSDIQTATANNQRDLAVAEQQAKTARPPQNIAAIARVNQLQATINALRVQAANLQPQINAESQRKAQFDGLAPMLLADPPLTPQQIASLRGVGIVYVDWGSMWDDFYEKYQSLKSAYAGVVKAFQSHAGLPRIDDFQFTPADQQVLQQIQAIAGDKGEVRDWNNVKKSVSDIQADYLNTLDALNALVRKVNSIRGSGLQVLVDPKALADAPPEARHKLHLTFHGQSQEKVKVGEKDMDITT